MKGHLYRRLLLLFFSITPSVMSSPSAADVEAAKRERRVVFYTTMNVDQSVPMVKDFESRYPFLKVDLYRAGGPILLNKILTEERAGRKVADVIMISLFEGEMLKRKGLFDRYLSPEAAPVRDGFKDPDGY